MALSGCQPQRPKHPASMPAPCTLSPRPSPPRQSVGDDATHAAEVLDQDDPDEGGGGGGGYGGGEDDDLQAGGAAGWLTCRRLGTEPRAFVRDGQRAGREPTPSP